MRIPKTIYTLKSNLVFVIGLMLFTLFFAIIYTPTYGLVADGGDISGLTGGELAVALWYQQRSLCLPIGCAIILAATALSRTLMLLTTRTARLRETDYLWWQLGEVATTALFLDLFLSIFLHIGFLENLPLVLLVYLSVAIYPYAAYWLLVERIDRDVRLAEASHTIQRLRHQSADEGGGMLRLTDASGVVRLVVSTDKVVGIEAAGNYVNVIHLSSERISRFSLRNTMTGVEALCDGTSLVRCHRSWYINLAHVRLLRKTPDGLMAELDVEGIEAVPVSKSYVTDVTARFSQQ